MKTPFDWEQIVSHFADPVFIVQGRRLVYANSAFQQFIGQKLFQTPISKIRLTLLFPGKGGLQIRQSIQDVQETYEKVTIAVTLMVGSTPHYTKVSLCPLNFKGSKRPHILGLLKDETEWKQIETELEESKARYKDLIEQSLQGIIVFQDGRIVYANKIILNLTRTSSEELRNWNPMEWTKYVHPDDRDVVVKRFHERIKGKRIQQRYECRLVYPSGKIRWIELLANRILWEGRPANQVIILDITDRKHTEAALKESEGRYRTLIESLNEAVLVTDKDANITYANPRALRLLGYTWDEFIGKGWRILVPPDLQPRIEKELKKRRRGIGNIYESEVLDSKGHRIPIIVSAQPLFTEGEFQGIVVAYTDISAIKQLEHQLRFEKQESEFYTAVVTHDLNNVHQAIMSYLELLKTEPAESPHRDELLNNAMTNVKRAVNLSQQVRRFFKIRATTPKLKEVNLVQVLQHIAGTTPKQHPDRPVSITLDLPKDKVLTWCDELVEELFHNLVENAIEHTTTHEVNVKIRIKPKPVIEKEEAYWHVQIIDYGSGIPDDMKEVLLRPFETGETYFKRKTLGLVIVRTLTDRYGGKTWFSDRVLGAPSKGTIANILLHQHKVKR
ncbi:MAG: PAS domain S-box protein [Promethearchaeota archaeon]